MNQKLILKTYWHILTVVSKYMTQTTDSKFTKDELHEVFKYAHSISTVKTLKEEEWGQYIVDIIIACLTVFEVPSSLLMPTDLKGVQWTNFEDK